jgi:hypothetical protein
MDNPSDFNLVITDDGMVTMVIEPKDGSEIVVEMPWMQAISMAMGFGRAAHISAMNIGVTPDTWSRIVTEEAHKYGGGLDEMHDI